MVTDHSWARALRAVSCTVWIMSVLAAPAHATTVVSKSFAALCAEADMIFTATVGESRSQWVDAEHGDIETLVTFTAIEPIVGVSAPSVTLRFAGGTVDGIREEFLGVPRFTAGERVVLFARNGYQLSPLVGMSQGCFRVVESPAGPTVVGADGRPVAALDSSGVSADGGQGASGAPLSLSRFLDAVRNELDAQGRRD